MKKILFVLFLSGITLTACKKEGCTNPLATNYDSKAKKDDGSCVVEVDPNTAPLCAGVELETKMMPIGLGYKWTYQRSLGAQTSLYSEEIIGTEEINGLGYYIVEFVNDELSTTGTFHYRVDVSTGDIYKRGGDGVEVLFISGNPYVGQAINEGTVTNINATFTTAACLYSGCVEITESTLFGNKKTYFKKGLGLIKSTNSGMGGDELTGVSF